MNAPPKSLFSLCTVTLIVALTGCTADVASEAAPTPTASAATPPVTIEPAPAASSRPTASASPAAPGCTSHGRFEIGGYEGQPSTSKLSGIPKDFGAVEYASGEVTTDAAGTPIGYTVAAGDTPYAIEDRLCYSLILLHNGVTELHPGQYLSLLPEDYVPLD